MHIRVALTKQRQRIGYRLDERGRGGKADTQFARFPMVQAGGAGGGVLHLGENLSLSARNCLPAAVRLTLRLVRANRRRRSAARGSEFAGLTALRDVQSRRGAAKMQLLGDGDKVAQMTQLDIHI